MPVIVILPIEISNVDGTVLVGYAQQITPKLTAKIYSGSVQGNTGDFQITQSLISFTNTLDSDMTDNTTDGR